MEKDRYILTEEECVEKGGHKYDEGVVFAASPYRVCRYCGHPQKGYAPPTVWEDC